MGKEYNKKSESQQSEFRRKESETCFAAGFWLLASGSCFSSFLDMWGSAMLHPQVFR